MGGWRRLPMCSAFSGISGSPESSIWSKTSTPPSLSMNLPYRVSGGDLPSKTQDIRGTYVNGRTNVVAGGCHDTVYLLD